jgi:hypothetical protein
MTKSEYFRRQAAICDEQAAVAVDPEDRAGFEKLAWHWRELAAQADALEAHLNGGLAWSGSRESRGDGQAIGSA